MKDGHIKIGKKYINRVCTKEVDNKLITIESIFISWVKKTTEII